MGDKIIEGDIVDIFFPQGEAIFGATVLGMPCATGDSWRLRTKQGDLLYMQSFETMMVKGHP
jgi:hypothetical protein